MSIGWQGKLTRLVPLDKARHLENCLAWFNDPQTTEWLLMGDFPLARLAEEEWFDRLGRTNPKSNPDDVGFAIETLDGEHIGMCGIHLIDWRSGVGTTGTIIGRRDLWGRGYGSDAIHVRTQYAFDTAGLRMLLSEVMADNVKSLRALTKAGYREVGRVPQRHWKRGAFRDNVILCVLAEEWRAGGSANVTV